MSKVPILNNFRVIESGESVSIATVATGYITNGLTHVRIYIQFPHSLEKVNKATLTTLNMSIRTVAGNYILGKSDGDSTWLTDSSITITPTVRKSSNQLFLQIALNSGTFSGETNNSPVIANIGMLTVTFTYQA